MNNTELLSALTRRIFIADINQTPFQVSGEFDDNDHVRCAWELLFHNVCGFHAPFKDGSTTRFELKMKHWYKLPEKAVTAKHSTTWSDCKQLRNEITSDLRTAEDIYFHQMLEEVKSSRAYWKLILRSLWTGGYWAA